MNDDHISMKIDFAVKDDSPKKYYVSYRDMIRTIIIAKSPSDAAITAMVKFLEEYAKNCLPDETIENEETETRIKFDVKSKIIVSQSGYIGPSERDKDNKELGKFMERCNSWLPEGDLTELWKIAHKDDRGFQVKEILDKAIEILNRKYPDVGYGDFGIE